MTSFEQYLTSKGYIRYSFNEKTKKYIQPEEYNLSSIGGESLEYTYFHKDDIDKIDRIVFGLSEKGKPPTLIYPRPSIAIEQQDGTITIGCTDDYINQFLLKKDNHDILNILRAKGNNIILI